MTKRQRRHKIHHHQSKRKPGRRAYRDEWARSNEHEAGEAGAPSGPDRAHARRNAPSLSSLTREPGHLTGTAGVANLSERDDVGELPPPAGEVHDWPTGTVICISGHTVAGTDTSTTTGNAYSGQTVTLPVGSAVAPATMRAFHPTNRYAPWRDSRAVRRADARRNKHRPKGRA